MRSSQAVFPARRIWPQSKRKRGGESEDNINKYFFFVYAVKSRECTCIYLILQGVQRFLWYFSSELYRAISFSRRRTTVIANFIYSYVLLYDIPFVPRESLVSDQFSMMSERFPRSAKAREQLLNLVAK